MGQQSLSLKTPSSFSTGRCSSQLTKEMKCRMTRSTSEAWSFGLKQTSTERRERSDGNGSFQNSWRRTTQRARNYQDHSMKPSATFAYSLRPTIRILYLTTVSTSNYILLNYIDCTVLPMRQPGLSERTSNCAAEPCLGPASMSPIWACPQRPHRRQSVIGRVRVSLQDPTLQRTFCPAYVMSFPVLRGILPVRRRQGPLESAWVRQRLRVPSRAA